MNLMIIEKYLKTVWLKVDIIAASPLVSTNQNHTILLLSQEVPCLVSDAQMLARDFNNMLVV